MEQQAVQDSFRTRTLTDKLSQNETPCVHKNEPAARLAGQSVDGGENNDGAHIYSVREGGAKHQTTRPFTTNVLLHHQRTGQTGGGCLIDARNLRRIVGSDIPEQLSLDSCEERSLPNRFTGNHEYRVL